jgi:hypothetical protein
MDFDNKPLTPDDFRAPICSESECLRNTSPEVLHSLILGYLQAMTGHDWDVRVQTLDINDVGEFLMVKAQVNMDIAKEKFGQAPRPLIVPKEKVAI